MHRNFGFAEVIGTLACFDPQTGQIRMVISFSGTPEESEKAYLATKPNLPADYVFANPHVDPKYWAGRNDLRFRSGKNADGSLFEGDSLSCVEPRLFQCVLKLGWIVTGMSLGWNGKGTNPFPADLKNPNNNKMRSCPSCEANRSFILAGVKQQPEMFVKIKRWLRQFIS